ncbi:MAG TPA: site-2 protease family protein [Polyangiaceae bacterium]|nr:site-2 protease family protein [Polyangiaceae bacterium]
MRGFRIGRVFGIELRVDWSWLLIFVLMTWNLTIVFSHWHPTWTPAVSFVVALAASLLFFLGVVVHELAHSLVAQGFGVRVRSITLFLFGGVSNIKDEPPSAWAEFLIAIVGPLTSIAIGIGFFILGGLMVGPSAFRASSASDPVAIVAGMGPLVTLLVWLGPINVLIGLFNLIPAFPMDGGRVLRAILWGSTRDMQSSTRIVSGVGQAIGWGFIGLGIAMTFGLQVPFFGTGLIGGLWLAFIGWFLQSAAAQARTRAALDELLVGHTVEELMRRQGTVASPDITIDALVHDYLVPSEERAFPVMRDGRLLGLVSISDVRRVPRDEWPSTPVRVAMRGITGLITTTPETPLATAFELLAQEDVEQLPVLRDGMLVGMLRRRDIARWLEISWGHGPQGRGPKSGYPPPLAHRPPRTA